MSGDVDDEAELRALQRSTDRKTLALLLGTAVVLTALGIGALELWWHHSSGHTSAADQSVTVPPGPTTTVDQRPIVEQAYRDFVKMAQRLQGAPDPTDPEIAARTTDRERVVLESNLAKQKAEGTVLRIGPQTRQTIESNKVTGDSAQLVVCYVGQSGAYDAATGAVKSPMAIITEPFAVSLTSENGAWKVSHVRSAGQPVQGVSTCAS